MSKYNLFLKNNSKVTPENLKLLYEEVQLMKNANYIDKNEEQCKEVVQYIIEYLIYGDKHDSAIFDLFCEFNFMNEFIYLANLNHRSMNLQIIKSFSLLILNLTNTTTLYYIFSNNFINQIVSNDYEKYDDDFLSYYVNFLKSLSLKIDQTTIQFFFHKQLNSFPLLQSALKLYNHTDPMIKNVVRNIILTVLKIKYEPITEYFSTLPSITYFPFLSCRLRDLVIKMNEEITSDDQASLKSIHDDIIDDILYIQDIFSLKIEKINYILTNSLFYYMVLPLLCGSLVSMTKPRIAISVAIYVLLALFYYIKDQAFLNAVFTVLFSERLTKQVTWFMEDYPKSAKNYFFDWNAQKKSGYSSSFIGCITSNFSEPFIKSLLYQTNSPYPEVTALIKKYDKLAEEMSINSPHFMKSLIEDVLAKFSNSEFDIMTTYHKNISTATGVNVGLSMSEGKDECFLKCLERDLNEEVLQGDNRQNKIDENSNSKLSNGLGKGVKNVLFLFRNECRENLYSYLKSKDDTLILLVSLLIFTIHRKGLSKELLFRTKLMKANQFVKSEYDTSRILNEIFSVDFGGSQADRNSKNKNTMKNINKNINKYPTRPSLPVNNGSKNVNINMINDSHDNSHDDSHDHHDSQSKTNAYSTSITNDNANKSASSENIIKLRVSKNEREMLEIKDSKNHGNSNSINSDNEDSSPFEASEGIIRTDQIYYEVESQDGNFTTSNRDDEPTPIFDNVYFTNLFNSISAGEQTIYDSELIDNFLNVR